MSVGGVRKGAREGGAWRRPVLALGAVGLVLAVLALAEGLVRVLVPASPARRAEAEFVTRSLGYLAPCMERTRREGQDWLVSTSRSGMTGQAVAMPRARTPGVARVAVVGESSGAMLAQEVGRVLAARPCGRRYELLACAQPGSGLEHLERRFDEVMGYQPDAVVVVFGHNLRFRFPMDAGRLRLRALRDHSRLLSLLGALVAGARPGFLDEPVDGPVDGPVNGPGDGRRVAARLARFERFLHRAGGVARQARVALVATTPAENLWMPPGAMRTEIWAPAVLRARYLEATAGPTAAAASMSARTGGSQVASQGGYEDFTRGVLLARAGDTAGAGAALRAAVDEDPLDTRAPMAVADVLRRVSSAEGFALRDTARAVESRAPGGLPGWEAFWDNCHLRPEVFSQEAAAVLARVPWPTGERGLCGVQVPPFTRTLEDQLTGMAGMAGTDPDPEVSTWQGALALRVEQALTVGGEPAAATVAAFAAGEGQGREGQGARDPARRARVLTALAEGLYRAGRREQAMALNARAGAGTGPAAAAAWVQRGSSCWEGGMRRGMGGLRARLSSGRLRWTRGGRTRAGCWGCCPGKGRMAPGQAAVRARRGGCGYGKAQGRHRGGDRRVHSVRGDGGDRVDRVSRGGASPRGGAAARRVGPG